MLAPLSPRGWLHRSRGRRPGRTAGVRVPPALTRPRQPRLASNPTPRPGHGTPDRQPVRRLAFGLHPLPAIATRYCSTLAPSSLRGRLHRSRERRPGRTAGVRVPPARATPAATLAHVCNRCLPASRPHDQATATPIGSRYAVSPSSWPACRRSPPGTARHWRRRCLVAGFTNREDKGPEELPVIEHRQHGSDHGNRGLPATRHHDQATATPIGSRRAVSPSTWPDCRRSPPGTARPWRRRRLVAGCTDREDTARHWRRRRFVVDRALRDPDQATARPIGSRCAASPSPWPACRRSPPGTARHWRCHRLVSGCTDREDKGPEELPVIEHPPARIRLRQPRLASHPTP
jgi:hypothetical protein